MTDTKMTKTVGEHFACFMLARHGWAPALTRDGIARTDILAVHTGDSRSMVEIQVKAKHDGGRWRLGAKAQQPSQSGREWFVLVTFGRAAQSEIRSFVVPRDHVAAAAWISHMAWRTDPTARPGTRNAGPDASAVSEEAFIGYEDRWDLLRNSAHQSPILLPASYHGLALDPRIGLPDEHPWRKAFPAAWGA